MNDSDPVLLDEVVRAAHDAMLASDWDRLRLILHPYLHWAAADGSRLRGRTKGYGSVAERSAAGRAGRC
jgi:hypothetical protein